MTVYKKYKAWWFLWQSEGLTPSAYWGSTKEEAFERHVKDLGLYALMEILSIWED